MFLLQRFNTPLLTPFRENGSKMVLSYGNDAAEPISGVKTAKKNILVGVLAPFPILPDFPP